MESTIDVDADDVEDIVLGLSLLVIAQESNFSQLNFSRNHSWSMALDART